VLVRSRTLREPAPEEADMNRTRRWSPSAITRRHFLAAGAASTLAGCATAANKADNGDPARIIASPSPPTASIDAGAHPLELGDRRDGVLFVPRSAPPAAGFPLAVMLHGAGGSGARVRFAFAIAEELGVVVLAPDSRGRTWDAIHGKFGPDVTFISAALQHALARVAVDLRRLAVGGFSDGASYALSLGIANGDLFTHVLAFSPGFIVPTQRRGKPAVFISHGTQDDVLPVAQTSQVIVPDLRNRGYVVRYREFGGPHTVPQSIAREAFQWLTR
jgi:phospholipase/carboxylesterase